MLCLLSTFLCHKIHKMTSIVKEPYLLNVKIVNCNYSKYIVIICETHFVSFIFQELWKYDWLILAYMEL